MAFLMRVAAGAAIATAILGTLARAAATDTSDLLEDNSMHLVEEEADAVNHLFHNFIFIICGFMAFVIVCWRITIVSVKYVRLLTCLTNDKQRYFLAPYRKYATLKKHFLDAPIGSKRHNREFQLSTAVNMGMLPTRFQFIFLVLYLATNLIFCVIRIHWDQPYRIVAIEVRHRTGILAVVNMVPLFLMATRNSPFIYWLDMSFQTFNLFHRWFGRIVVFESLVHTLAWLFSTSKIEGWQEVAKQTTGTPMVTWGWVVSTSLALFDCLKRCLMAGTNTT